MKTKKIAFMSNIMFIISTVFALGVILKIYLDSKKVAQGICPTNNNRTWIVIAILLLILTTIVSSVFDYKVKKERLKSTSSEPDLSNDNELGVIDEEQLGDADINADINADEDTDTDDQED